MTEPLQPIKWDDATYSTGIVKIDDQHKQLVGLLNNLILNKNPDDKEFTTKVFTTLVVFVRTHFQDEERLLRKIHYPGFDHHHQTHIDFSNKVVDLKIVLKY